MSFPQVFSLLHIETPNPVLLQSIL